jgi:hypothetical protein
MQFGGKLAVLVEGLSLLPPIDSNLYLTHQRL